MPQAGSGFLWMIYFCQYDAGDDDDDDNDDDCDDDCDVVREYSVGWDDDHGGDKIRQTTVVQNQHDLNHALVNKLTFCRKSNDK